jgi:hypothetical protein
MIVPGEHQNDRIEIGRSFLTGRSGTATRAKVISFSQGTQENVLYQ